MKILNVSNTLDPITGGGEAERSFQMSKFLVRLGADCHVLTVDTGLSVERKGFLGKGGVIALPCLLRRFYIPKFSFRVINELVHEADIVHLMGHWTILNALVYLAIRKKNKPYVVCPAGALPIFGRSKLIKMFYNFVVGKQIIRNASMCIAVTPDEERAFKAYGVRREEIQVIPNGIAASDFMAEDNKKFREKYELGMRPFILFMGRLNLIKGPDLLLEAFCNVMEKFPEFDLVFVGPDGGMLAELQVIAKSAGAAGRVHFVGYLGGVDKSHAYHAAAFLAIPSRHEAMSIVALEAGICGTPVLLTDQCGFNQIADVGGGWVVPATVEGIGKGLNEVLRDASGVERASVKIKEYVAESFSWEVVVLEYCQLYSTILKVIDHAN
ncbi:glycosyltransferase [Sulfuriferula nivalis]|uniref:Glycosyl transferase n=1 Tax=Sulfuriferula nivalis TaxID=2675298 RepID=A0A809RE88_9PROT|nr:glycosyltransferase [Sulfuriferula nivalis]BBO99934.1 glycosyl transferase [Sulfuriferula nivalis]